MRIVFDLRHSVTDNAKAHYERSKKFKGKIEGMKKAIEDTKKKIGSSSVEEVKSPPKITKRREKRWYESFRWFNSSQGYLVLGGRDATSNEILIKKHLENSDRVLHANIQGAPFFVIKNPDNNEIPTETIGEAATAAASYSKAWSRGLGSADVYEIMPEQVSKTPPSGEYLPKGAFMIYGEKIWHKNIPLEISIGTTEDLVLGGPTNAITAVCKKHVRVGVGDIGQGNITKRISHLLEGASTDEIQRFLPAGGSILMK